MAPGVVYLKVSDGSEAGDPAIKRDFLLINEERYLMCDSTFINAPIGRTMPGMDNARAQAICLD